MATRTTSTVKPSVNDLSTTRGLSVLVVADRSCDAEVLSLTLEVLGCEVATVPLGTPAVDLAYLAQPDVVVVVAGGGGWEAVPSAIAERAGWRKPFVIALTPPGYPGGTPVGVHAALVRPVCPDLLAGLIHRFHDLLEGILGFDPVI